MLVQLLRGSETEEEDDTQLGMPENSLLTALPGIIDIPFEIGQARMPDAIAIRTLDDAALRSSADAFGADYGTLTADDGEEQVYHTGSLYAVDDRGRLLLSWPFGVLREDLHRDLDRLLDETVGDQA